MTTVIPATKARNDFLKLIDLVYEKYTRLDVTKQGVVKASIVSPDYLEALEETAYSLENSLDDIGKSEAEIKEGKYTTLEDYRRKLRKKKNAS